MEEKIKEIYSLIEQWTRAEILARHAPFSNFEAANYFEIKIQKENELRKLLFGTDDLVELGLKWELLKDRTTQKEIENIEDKEQNKEDLKQKYLRLQKELAEMEGK